nr:DNA topoisomerase 2 [Tanacetum cinerariifolium]
MHLFDEDGVIKKYDTPEQILKEFFDIRLRFYEKRRTAQLCELKKDKLLLENKARVESKNFEPLPETGYHYLISIGLESLTYAKALELRRELVAKEEEINLLTNTTPEYLWDKDLDALAQQLDEQDKEDIIKREQAERRNARIAKEAPKKKAPTKRTAAKGEQEET